MAPAVNKAPVIEGPTAAARARGTAVKLAAAGRSAGVTTDITKALRAGTSICESALLRSRGPSAAGRDGARGGPIRQRVGGVWGKTIVLMRAERVGRGGPRGW